jgi:hypothetical protein
MAARQSATHDPASTGAPELLALVDPPLVEELVVPLVVPVVVPLVVPLDVVPVVVPLVDEDVVRPELVTPELLMPPLDDDDVVVMPEVLPLVDAMPEELPVVVLVSPLLRPDDASPLKSSPGSAAHAATVPTPTLAKNTHTRTVERKEVMR